ncbi:M48 family metallopeptidase [Glacieibacterium frigidum]|uniref:M48 family metalloprotease n=1 Tax=Glacieibacterium frigidum TaxID=2593303 RepID=A0A552UJB8_9SPHN|nr:M48 family metallopeptidase [Glacieibacterium frigidum]TRW18275.1 M48 family metalloprotease [Glacieibacterium frigidum]
MKSIDLGQRDWSAALVEPRFAPLVARLEVEAAANPDRYRRRVFAAALLGYVVLFGVVALLLGGIVALIVLAFAAESGGAIAGAVKIGLVLGIPALIILRALWFRIDPPLGTPITADDAPALFASIEHIRAATGGPSLHAVLITDDFNAAIVQQPRFGMFGGHRNYLMLGLPLLQALDTPAVEAVIAHEFGHLANADGKLGTWIYRVRTTWARLAQSLDGGAVTAVLRRFFNWYGPWFGAWSFVLARQTEYAADRVSALATSPATAARALVTVAVEADRFQSEHWRAVIDAAERHDRPPAMPYAAARGFFAAPSAGRGTPLARALAVTSGLEDTHPALAQRLVALGEASHEPLPCARSAAEDLLPDGGAALAAAFDANWWAANEEAWAAAREGFEASVARLAELDLAAADGSIAPAERFDRAALTERVRGGDAAMPLYAALVTDPGKSVDIGLARRAIVRLRLDGGDEAALADLEALLAASASVDETAMLIDLASQYFAVHAPADPRHAAWQDRAAATAANAAARWAELNRIDAATAIEPALVDNGQRAALAEIGASWPEIVTIHIASRTLAAGPPNTQHVLVYRASSTMSGERNANFLDAVLAVLSQGAPAIALQSTSAARWLDKKMRAGELVYDRRRGAYRPAIAQ